MPTPDPGKLFPLPKQDDAPRICVNLQIPGDQESISNFIGALMRLALWNNYRRDDNKRAKNIAQVWKGIVRDIEFYNCNEPPGAGGGCEDGCEDMCCLRVHEGKLQSLQCGVWTTIPGGDLLSIVGQGVQQPPPGGTLESGDCKEYDVTLYGSNAFNLPITVDAGNTIEITLADGGWSDGDGVGLFPPAWACPSGQVYALGTCGAAGTPEVGDPLPSVAHMRLIAAVDGVWKDAYNTTITVGAGVSGAAVQFQANDPTLANNLGSITFHVKVCNTPEPALPVGVNIVAGSGANQVVSGGVYLYNSDGSSNTSIDLRFDSSVKITILASTLDHPSCGSPCVYFQYFNPTGTLVQDYTYPPTHVSDIPPQPLVQRLNVLSGTATPFTMTLKIEF